MPPRDAVDTLLFGANPVLSTQFVRVAGGLFFLAVIASLPVHALDSISVTGQTVTAVVALAMLSAAAVAAYVNGGLLIAIALTAGISLGFYAPAILFDLAAPGGATLWVLVAGSFSAIAAGVVGFLIGAGLRRATEK
ncbi:MAG: hypothetical protein ACOCQU_03015 [Halolamina sp.]